MPQAQKLYPRSTIKRIIKAHSGRNVGKNVDILVRFLLHPTDLIRFYARLSPLLIQLRVL